jgi:hypothetical protein
VINQTMNHNVKGSLLLLSLSQRGFTVVQLTEIMTLQIRGRKMTYACRAVGVSEYEIDITWPHQPEFLAK